MDESKKQSWFQNLTKKQKTWLGVIGAIVILGIVGNIVNPKPSACKCIENMDLGYYDALNDKDREMRDKCLKAYAGNATLYIECKKERGE